MAKKSEPIDIPTKLKSLKQQKDELTNKIFDLEEEYGNTYGMGEAGDKRRSAIKKEIDSLNDRIFQVAEDEDSLKASLPKPEPKQPTQEQLSRQAIRDVSEAKKRVSAATAAIAGGTSTRSREQLYKNLEEAKNHLAEKEKALKERSQPASMTVGAIAPGTDKPMQLIPQSKTITPEVLPPETPKGGAKKRIAGLLGKLQENHEAGTKKAAQISAVAHTALKGIDPTHTPQMTAPTASTYEPPKGSGRQRVAKLMGDLQSNHEADVKNAAMTYAVAQSAVNQLKAQEAGQKAAPKQLSGQAGTSEGGGAIGIQKLNMSSFESLLKDIDQVDVSQYRSQEPLITSEAYRSAMRGQGKRSGGSVKGSMGGPSGLTGTRATLAIPNQYTQDLSKDEKREIGELYVNERGDYLRGRIKGLSHNAAMAFVYGLQDPKSREAALKVIQNEVSQRRIESAPLAPTTKSRKAGDDPKYRGKRGHVSIDSITGAIAQLQQRGTHIDSATALELLRKADNCGCDECQHKDETSKYDRLVKSLAAKGVDDPKALAAAIGRRKLGKKEFQRRAKAGAKEAAKA